MLALKPKVEVQICPMEQSFNLTMLALKQVNRPGIGTIQLSF
jgi:hypothetical protein